MHSLRFVLHKYNDNPQIQTCSHRVWNYAICHLNVPCLVLPGDVCVTSLSPVWILLGLSKCVINVSNTFPRHTIPSVFHWLLLNKELYAYIHVTYVWTYFHKFSKQFDNFQIFLFFSPKVNQIFIYEPTSDIIRNAHLTLVLRVFSLSSFFVVFHDVSSYNSVYLFIQFFLFKAASSCNTYTPLPVRTWCWSEQTSPQPPPPTKGVCKASTHLSVCWIFSPLLLWSRGLQRWLSG